MSQPGWLDWPPSSKTRILKPSARQRGFERFGWRPHWVIPIQLEYFVEIFFQPALLSSHHRSVLPSFPPHWDVLTKELNPKSPSRVLWAGKSKDDRRLKVGKSFCSFQLIAHPPQSMWAKGVKAFTFHKKTNSSSSQTSQGGKVSISLFFWWSVKTPSWRC